MTAICYHCGDRPAACYGAYEGSELAAGACDICCGHGNEDGWCIQIADLLEREALVLEVIATVREMFGAPITMDAYCERRERLVQVARKLSEWKP